jgi:D-alanyl-D-alanine carboxypeptidase
VAPRRLLVAIGLAVSLAGAGCGAPASPVPGSGSASASSTATAPNAPASRSTPAAPGSDRPPSPTPTAGPPASPTARPSLAPGVSAALEIELRVGAALAGVPGAEASVQLADGSTWSGAYGWADVAAGRPMEPSDVFDIGSVSKTFVAAEVLVLAAEGRLTLDAPLARWLPSFPNAGRITVRELLSHTIGIADYFNNPKLLHALDANRSAAWTPTSLLPYVGKALFTPGRSWSYSNTNYLLLGMIVRAVEGTSVGAAIERRFLGPLRLDHTTIQGDVPAPPPPRVGPAAQPYARTGNGPLAFKDLADGSGYLPYESLATSLDAAGSIVSRSDDLVRWAAALYGGRVLPPTSLALMLDDSVTKPLHPVRDYALGVEHQVLAGHETVGHSGACSGYRATMRYVPDLGAAVVVLVNEDGPDPDAIAARLIEAIASTGARNGAIG